MPDDLDAWKERALLAVRTHDAVALDAALAAGVPVETTSPAGDTLLMLAAYNGGAALVTRLAALGAKFDEAGPRGMTPLVAAAFKGDLASVEALLAAGADATRRTKDGSLPADFARMAGYHQVAERLEREG